MSEKISFVIPYPRAREQRERKVHVAGKGTFIQNKSFRARSHGRNENVPFCTNQYRPPLRSSSTRCSFGFDSSVPRRLIVFVAACFSQPWRLSSLTRSVRKARPRRGNGLALEVFVTPR